jgi:carboxyl-terminal processing protease
VPPGDIGYVRLLAFAQPAHAELLTALRTFESKKPNVWILDLRLHSGGEQRTMLATPSNFLKDGPFGFEVDRLNRRVSLGPDGSYLARPHPLVLLAGDATSSHAELFASTVQHYQAGTFVGTKTAGCLGVATRFQLNDGSALFVTVKKILGPSGQEINKAGVTPMEIVEVTRADRAASKDPQLQRALAILGAPSK